MKRRFVACLLMLVWSSQVLAQSAVTDALDAYIAAAREAWGVPGLAVAIVKDGDVALAKGYGVREEGGEAAVDADTLFAIASNTKAFTAAAVALLVEQHALKWLDRVQDHLPYFRLYDPYVSADMRVEDLLCHRSGLGTFSGDLLWYGTDYAPAEIIRRARFLPAAGPFRAHYGYSNLMFLAAGEVVAETSQQSWAEFVQQRILTPLRMDRTIASVTQLEQLGNYAMPHKPTPSGIRTLAWQNWDHMTACTRGLCWSLKNDWALWS